MNTNGTGVGIKLINTKGHRIHSSVQFAFKATNNNTEYEALFAGLKLALEMKIENLRVFSDFILRYS